jgi:hypothetical protein
MVGRSSLRERPGDGHRGINVVHLPDSDLPALRRALASLAAAGARSVQFLGAIDDHWTPEGLDPIVTGLGIPVFGGLFPSVIFEGRAFTRGAVLIGHEARTHVVSVDISGAIAPVQDRARHLDGLHTIVAYLDATCPSGHLMRALFDAWGANATWCGGGAGGLDFIRRPTVVTPDGLRAGAAVLAGLDTTTRLGVTHGWKPFGDPLLVTESRGNDIVTLDWRPALEVYREAVEHRSGTRFGQQGFFDIASRFPLMIERFGAEGVVRDPLSALDGGAIRCAGDIPQHSTVRVATGSFEDMIAAAARVRQQAAASAAPAAGTVALTIDCISRAILLGDRLPDELDALRVPGAPQAEALTIGEVASSSNHFLQMHNKTTVLAVIAPGSGAS